jgi:general secretion pathway protein J
VPNAEVRARQRGFTLLEVIVALMVFSTISLAAFRVLSSTGALQQRADQRLDDLAALQRSVSQLDRDLDQLLAWPAPQGTDELELPEGEAVTLVSGGRRNPLQRARSQLAGVAWVLDDDGVLWRSHWDGAGRDAVEIRSREMLRGVDAIEWRFLDEESQWLDSWPPPPSAQDGDERPALPLAVEVRLQTQTFGEVWRHVALR